MGISRWLETQKIIKMYAAFSRGFGKAGNDLIKKDFKDPVFEHKLTTKAKAADGTTFEANVCDQNSAGKDQPAKYETADFAVTIPVDDGFKVTVKTEANQDKSVKVDYKIDANANANATFTNPCISDNKPGTVDVGANYATKDFSAELEARVFKDGKTDAAGLVLGLAAPVPTVDGLSIGARPTFTKDGDAAKMNLNVNAAFDQKDYGLSVNTFWSNFNADNSLKYHGMEIIGMAKVNADCSVAAAFRQYDQGAGAPGFPFKLYEKGAQKAKKEFAVATQYKLSKSQTSKTKFTYDLAKNEQTIGLSLKTALEGKSSLTMSMDLKGVSSKPAFGLVYNLE